jgi:crotonobetainyl-CoA:carnitine CoA-transferase CaiB-like acyl-CoA transferase
MSGLMSLNGMGTDSGKPVGTSFSIVDRLTALHATIGALAALRHRDETGQGQVVDACLMDAALTMTEIPISFYLSTGTLGGESGRPPYEAKDGYVVIAAGSNERMVRKIAETVGINLDEAKIDRNESGGSFFGLRVPELMAWCKSRTVAEICEYFNRLGIPAAPVLTIPEAAKNEHLWARELLVPSKDADGNEMYVPGLSIKFSKTPGKTGAVPKPGQHSDEILAGVLNYDEEKIEELKSRNVI